MKILQLIIMFGLISFMACKKEKPVMPSPEGTSLPDDFQTFYDKFHTDSVFQMSHIIFPLQGQPSLTDTSAYIPDNFTSVSYTHLQRDSNPHASQHQILSLACLPISSYPQFCKSRLQKYKNYRFQIIYFLVSNILIICYL